MVATDLPNLATGPSIYEFIRAQLDPAGRLEDSGVVLPDEPKKEDGIRWAAGAMDGAFGHHGGGPTAVRQARHVTRLFGRACTKPSVRTLTKLYDAVSDDDALSFVDPMIEQLIELKPERDALHDLARWLTLTASARGAVKVGLAVLGVTGVADDLDVVLALGAHEEFTLYAAVALTNGLAEPDSAVWALASSVDGWGRIQCVERLRKTKDPKIKAWLLREGFRNSIMYEYLAYTAANAGGLLVELRAPDPDRELLTGAGEILTALVQGGPAEDLDDYEDGADAVEAYLLLMETRADMLVDFHSVWAIRSFLDRTDGWDERSERGWTATRRTAFEEHCAAILERPEWTDRIAVALLSEDADEFWRADLAAKARGIDTYAIHLDKIRADPLGGSWYQAWEQADGDRAEVLVALAREVLPLAEVPTGAADAFGFGPEFRVHNALDWTLQALRDHAGVGGDLVLIGLQSPVTRNRNMALNALNTWPSILWPDGARSRVEQVARNDPNDDTQELAQEVLATST